MAKLISTNNKCIATGEVFNVKIVPFKSGQGAIVNMGIRDRLHNNVIYLTLTDFGKGIRYNGNDYTPQALKNIFLDENDKTRNILVNAIAMFEENKYVNKQGIECVSARYNVIKIDNCTDETKQNITFNFKGYVKGVKEGENNTKIRIALPKVDKGGNMSGVSNVTVEAIDNEVIETISSKNIEKGCVVNLKGFILNTIEYDEFGDKIRDDKYNSISKIGDIIEADEDGMEEFVAQLKKAEKLEKGTIVTRDCKVVNAKEYYNNQKSTTKKTDLESPKTETPKFENDEDDDLGDADF